MSKIAKEGYVEEIKKTYLNESECMSVILSQIKPNCNMTLDECVDAYKELMAWEEKLLNKIKGIYVVIDASNGQSVTSGFREYKEAERHWKELVKVARNPNSYYIEEIDIV